jgi:ATP-dependent DNA helicase RecG
MHLAELEVLVSAGESETLEFKRTTGQRTDAFKTVCAMLNGVQPGMVVFGVKDDGQIVGQDVAATTLEQIAAECRRIDPPAHVEVVPVPVDERRSAIILHVQGGTGLYSYDGRPYQRIGPTTSVMPVQRYQQRLGELSHSTNRWENQPAAGIGLDDLDHDEIGRTVGEAVRRRLVQEPGSNAPETLLMRLGLLEGKQPLNAAVVLFAKPEALPVRYPQCLLRMARFRGTTKTEFRDHRQVMGNAFELYARGQQFWIDYLPVAGRIVPDQIERIDEPLYPTEALREALINALCHRDYSISGGGIEIAIFDDRLEITSAGGLHFGLTPAMLKKEHRSRLWNPLIANAFYLRGIIEQWGRGTNKIVELATEANLPEPEFEASATEVLVRFRSRVAKDRVSVEPGLTELQRELLEIVTRIGPASLAQIRDELSHQMATRTVQENLHKLRSLGLIELSGLARSARWFVS